MQNNVESIFKMLAQRVDEKQNLSISRLNTVTIDCIVEASVDFAVYSVKELESAMKSISVIKNVDEVSRIDIE